MKMNNPFKYSTDNKRYQTLNYHYFKVFNTRVSKISLNAGFTCPNKDGKVSSGGCIYCSKSGSGDYAGNVCEDLVTQFYNVKNIIDKKWKNSKYIGYFQANTNTYAPLNILKEKYETILKLPDVIGISIATRPDAIESDVLEYLEELNKRTYLTIELGLQTIHESTSKLINRGHDLECFINTLNELRKRKINVVIHIINGLPYETKQMMIDTIKFLSKLDIQGIKIHMLHILKDTELETLYNNTHFKVLTKEEYIDIVCDQLEILPDKIVINRITGDPKEEDLIEPLWLVKKFGVLNDIDSELERRDTYQGFNSSILNKFKQILRNNVRRNDLVVDATVGNGNDTLFLSNLVPNGHVYGFDIQKVAIDNTKELLDKNNITNYTLFNNSHENILEVLGEYVNKISAVIFNLGYLPGGNKNIMTNYSSTIKALKGSLKLLNNKGIILIVIYSHEEGKKENIEINKYLLELDGIYTINKYHNTDNLEAPYLIEIKKKQ